MTDPGRVSLWATREPGSFCCSAPKAALRSPGARPGSGARTPAAAVTAAAPAAEAPARPRSTSRTQRKPMLLFLLSGSFLLRLAARRFLVSLLKEPPRNTRTLDRTPFLGGGAGLRPRAGLGPPPIQAPAAPPQHELLEDCSRSRQVSPCSAWATHALTLGWIRPHPTAPRAYWAASERNLLRNLTTFPRTSRVCSGKMRQPRNVKPSAVR